MPKNIVLLCDGTSNEISENRTNILRLYGTLKKDEKQLVFYDPGVGTFGAANAWSYYYRRFFEVWGLATGWGLDQNVKEAYAFLVRHYDDGSRPGDEPDEEPDSIYIFGFSRGAYSARVLAGFIHAIGLIDPVNLNLLDYAYRAYKNVGETRNGAELDEGTNPFAEVRLFERILRPRRPAIRCLGLFDTVGSVIEWGRVGPRVRGHVHTSTNLSVQSVRHAVGIDDRRCMFRPTLWPTGGEYWGGPFRPRGEKAIQVQDVDEVLFSGVHGDIGGGYPEDKSHLAKLPLRWLIDETRDMGLRYKQRTINSIVMGEDGRYVPPDALADRNESMTPGWRVVELVPRWKSRFSLTRRKGVFGIYLPLFEPRHIPDGARIHASVFDRRGTPRDYPQPNIPDDHTVV